MPCHWYYDVEALKKDFGTVEYYVDPKESHPIKAYMTLDDLIGKHILHNKVEAYKKDKPNYHDGLKAGDFTLDCEFLKVALKTLNETRTEDRIYDQDQFLENFITFLTTPGTHNDAYAESVYRAFVKNYINKTALRECAPTESDGFVTIITCKFVIPVLFAPLINHFRKTKAASDSVPEISGELFNSCIDAATSHAALVFRGDKVKNHVTAYSHALLSTALGKDLKESIAEASELNSLDLKSWIDLPDTDIIGKKFGIHCGLPDSLGLTFYLAYHYSSDFDKAIIKNTNIGGHNTGRGSPVAALVGANTEPLKDDSKWITGLNQHKAVGELINEYLKL